jgi:hypothetical protein
MKILLVDDNIEYLTLLRNILLYNNKTNNINITIENDPI